LPVFTLTLNVAVVAGVEAVVPPPPPPPEPGLDETGLDDPPPHPTANKANTAQSAVNDPQRDRPMLKKSLPVERRQKGDQTQKDEVIIEEVLLRNKSKAGKRKLFGLPRVISARRKSAAARLQA
jgi:hypothetical protein